MDIDPQTVKQVAPGALGALGAIAFMEGPWLIRVALILPGVSLSYFAYEDIARLTGMNPGLAGFTVGLLGMIFIAKIIATWQQLELGTILRKLLHKWLGVQGD